MLAKKYMTECLVFIGCFGLSACNSCTEQHDPTAHEAMVKAERLTASAERPQLGDDGSVPEAVEEDTQAVAAADGDNVGLEKYNTFCASCHGMDGKANNATAMAMNPKPRNLTDAAWQDSVTDEHLTKLLEGGGAAVGLSATMPAWGAMFSDDEIQKVVQVVRDFKGK